MTEDEAKTKWCPMVRISAFGEHTSSPPANRVMDAINKTVARNPRDCRCLGSECMMWRLSKPADPEALLRYANNNGLTTQEAMRELRLTEADFSAAQGYCGLAGGGLAP
jgi:hypothetical protein